MTEESGVTDYIVRKVPNGLWAKVKKRAEKDGHSLRWIIIKLLERYAKHGLDS